MSETILKVEDLKTSFMTSSGEVQAVRGVSFEVHKGEILGIVGESGSGKSVTSMSILRLLADTARIKNGKIEFEGTDLTKVSDKQMREIRGQKIAMVFQDPMSSLNPVYKVGDQVAEGLIQHTGMKKKEARAKVLEMFRKLGIPDPEERIDNYPHQFSGGMKQRVVIAIALSCNPELLIADEPTTALDVTIQAQVLDLIREMKEKMNSSVIMITHDLGVVASLCDRILIMYGGKIVESGSDREIFYDPKHPYTRGLLQCVHNPEKKEKLKPIAGSPPDLLKPPAGCPFVDRCPEAMKVCKLYMPEVTTYSATHQCACWLEEANRRKGENHG